ncbi:MAG: hypothetical protein K2P94_00830 [Rhodospirillaceae bacterium]|nr:hypothetical protein [Rhodospirillaceae bacterium]
MANPLLPAMGNLKRSADYASKAMQGLSALIKPHEQALQEEITALDAKVNAPLKLPDAPGPNYSATAQDIRTHFANLTEEKRLTRAMKAVQENDTITLGALLNAPGYLSGMDHVDSKTGRDLQAVLREAYKATHFGADLKRLATLRKSQEMIANGLETISGHTSALHPHDKLAAAVTLDKKARDLTANAEKYV